MPELDNLYGDGFLQPEEEKRRGLLSMLLGRGYQPPSPILHDMPVDPGFSPPPRTGPPIDPGFTGQPRTPQVPPALAAQSPGAAGVPPPLVSRASTKPVLGATPAPSVPPPLMTRGEAGPPMMRPDAPPILGAADRYSRYVQEAPQREDFSKYDLKPWQKILGGALATAAGGFSHKPELAGALGYQLFNRPEIKYQQAEGEYEKRLGQYKTAADVERGQAEERRKERETEAKPGAKISYHYTNKAGQEVSVYEDGTEKVGGQVLPRTLTPQEQAYQALVKRGLDPVDAYEQLRDKPAPPPKPSKALMLVPQSDGSSKAIEVTPGTVVPKGAETVPEFGKASQPTADEQRRADLARNMNENLDQLEEILSRRPELFGWWSGRKTEARGAIGTSDPDIASLKTIKEQMGMAMVGAHAMRNAQHVEAAGNSIVNSYHNSPDAIKGAIQKARTSLKTFIDDVQKGRGGAHAGGDADTVEVIAPDGQRGTIPRANLQKALKRGYKQGQ